MYQAGKSAECSRKVNELLKTNPNDLPLLTLKCHLVFESYCPNWNNTETALLPHEIPSSVYHFVAPVVKKLVTSTYEKKDGPSVEDLEFIRLVCSLCKGLACYQECYKFLSLQIARFKQYSKELWHFFLYAVSRINGEMNIQGNWAMKMFQLLKEPMYLRWSYLSSWMHPDPKIQKLIVNLAYKSILDEKEKKPFIDEWLRLVLLMLKKEDRWHDVVTLLLDHRSKSIDNFPIDRKTFLAEALLKNNQYVESSALFATLLTENCEEWSWWLGYFDTLKIIKEKQISVPESDIIALNYNIGDQTPFQLQLKNKIGSPLEFIKELQSIELKTNGSKSRRGPFLAELEYYFRFGFDSKLQNACVSYFNQFGSKPICFSDLKKYLTKSTCNDLKQQISDLDSKLNLDLIENKLEKYRKLSTFRKIEFYFKLYTYENEEYILNLIHDYKSLLPLGESLEATENQHGDDFLLLASYILIDNIQFNKYEFTEIEKNRLLRAIYILEYGLTKSKHNYQFKILLIRLYSLLNCFRRAIFIFDSLEIKNILWESMSYILLYDLYGSGMSKIYSRIMKSLLHYRYLHERETPDLLLLAYRNETFTKAIEFIEFKEKLDNGLSSNLFASVSLLNELDIFSSIERINDQLQMTLKSFNEISNLIEKSSNNDDLSVLVDFRSSDSNIGHPILFYNYHEDLIKIQTVSFEYSKHLIESLSLLRLIKDYEAQRLKVQKQIAKKNEKQAKKLAASISHLPSIEECKNLELGALNTIKQVNESYINLFNIQNSNINSFIINYFIQLFKLCSLSIDLEDRKKIETTLSELVQSYLNNNKFEKKYFGIYIQLIQITIIILKILSNLGFKPQNLKISTLTNTLLSQIDSITEQHNIDLLYNPNFTLFDKDVYDQVKSYFGTEEDKRQLNSNVLILNRELQLFESNL